MTHVKTAISLEKSLFQQVEIVTDELKVSRSSFISMLIEEYMRQRKKQQIADSLNAAYADELTEDELETMQRMLKNAQKIVDPW